VRAYKLMTSRVAGSLQYSGSWKNSTPTQTSSNRHSPLAAVALLLANQANQAESELTVRIQVVRMRYHAIGYAFVAENKSFASGEGISLL
jgi:hypothetical protein